MADAAQFVRSVDGRGAEASDDDAAARLRRAIEEACEGLSDAVEPARIYDETVTYRYEGMEQREVSEAAILAARSKIETEPDYSFAAARLLLGALYAEVFGQPTSLADAPSAYARSLDTYVRTGVAAS